MQRNLTNLFAVILVSVFGLWGCSATSSNYKTILADSSRPEAERSLDVTRKPDAVLPFFGVKAGDKVADLLAGRGYYSAILAQVVGDSGIVYSHNTRERDEWRDRFKQAMNVRFVVSSVDRLDLPQDGSFDFVLTHLNYHDLAPEARVQMNRRVLGALKRGGFFAVIDHSAKEGSGNADVKTLHRIDKLLVIKEVTGAGFKLAKEGTMLSRPDDPRDFNVNKIRNKDDRFVLGFQKP